MSTEAWTLAATQTMRAQYSHGESLTAQLVELADAALSCTPTGARCRGSLQLRYVRASNVALSVTDFDI